MAEQERLGLFLLGMVLLPGEVVPLHVFEERYKKLMADCADQPFGLCRVDDTGIFEVGCSAEISQIAERFDDGRLNVFIRGERRFRLVELIEPADGEAEYLSALVEYIADDDEAVPAEVTARTVALYRRLVEELGLTISGSIEQVDPLSYGLAATIDLDHDLRQELLELTSETSRLELMAEMLRKRGAEAAEQRRLREVIRGNGKGRLN